MTNSHYVLYDYVIENPTANFDVLKMIFNSESIKKYESNLKLLLGNLDKINLLEQLVVTDNLDLVKYLHENKLVNIPDVEQDNLISLASNQNSQNVLKYLLTLGYLCNTDTSLHPINNNNIECLKIIHGKLKQTNQKLHEKICELSAYFGSIDCLKYGHMNGCPITETTSIYTITRNHLKCLQYVTCNYRLAQDIAYTALKHGNIECFIHLGYIKYGWKPYIAYFVVWMEIMDFHRKPRTKRSSKYNQDKYIKHLHCLKYLYKHGCDFIKEEALTIAKKKKLDIYLIRYLDEL
jgi:hypothetical protein